MHRQLVVSSLFFVASLFAYGAARAATLKERFDIGNSSIILQPRIDQRSLGMAEALSRETVDGAFAGALGGVSFDVVADETAGRDIIFESSLHDLHVQLDTGEFLLRDLRGHDALGPALSDTEQVERHVLGLVAALGFAQAQALVRTTWLAAARREVSAPAGTETKQRVAFKSFVYRQLGGVPVDGDKLVFTYSLDGELRKVIGRWTPIDYRRSTLVSDLSLESFLERAERALVAIGVSPIGGRSIRLGTRYSTRAVADGTHVLRLVGFASVPLDAPRGDSPTGGTKITIHEFDLD
jgi:hypothetical protein